MEIFARERPGRPFPELRALTPQEARRLRSALGERAGLTPTDRQTCAGHVSALVRVLVSRVVEREHPEGWFFSEGHTDR